MATQEQSEEEKSKEQQAATTGATGGGVVGAGTGGATPIAGRKTRPGGFVGLQKYMQAQGGAGARMGKALAKEVRGEAQEAQQATQAAQTQFGQQAREVGDISQQILEDPTKVTAQQYQQATGGYTGPMGLQGEQYETAIREQREAQQQLGQLGTAAGQEALLRKRFGSPQYTRGLSSLDMALMGGSKAAQQQFKGLQEMYGAGGTEDIGAQLQTAETQAAERAKGLQARGAERAKAAQEALATATGQLQTDVTGAAKAESKAREDRYKALRSAIESGDVSQYANLFGGATQLKGAEQQAALAGLKSTGGVTAEQMATPEQLARARALEALGGTQVLGRRQEGRGMGQQGFTFDPEGFQAARRARVAEAVTSAPDGFQARAAGKSYQLEADIARAQQQQAEAAAARQAEADRIARGRTAGQEALRRGQGQTAAARDRERFEQEAQAGKGVQSRIAEAAAQGRDTRTPAQKKADKAKGRKRAQEAAAKFRAGLGR